MTIEQNRSMLGLVTLLVTMLPAMALAAERVDAGSYALLVASDRPGPGQQELKFAVRDAKRVKSVLTELGGYRPAGITLLDNPKPDQVERAIDQIAAKIERDISRGEKTVFLFYYSGHARANALNLGSAELPIARLRSLLDSMPGTVKVVVLDACQAGAVSGVKGIEPAADFSHNSVRALNTSGMVVMASSSASELSQESERIQGSYFTHHLLVGLRGAADADRNGKVTLDEAYGYTYDHTLVATAATAVGKQHVTLETDLRGKGEMILSWPRLAQATLEIPATLTADILIHREVDEDVTAELHKAAGSSIDLAFPPGDYVALVQVDDSLLSCDLHLSRGARATIDTSACKEVPPEISAAKVVELSTDLEWTVELLVGVHTAWTDSYNERLEDFGFDDFGSISLNYGLHVLAGIGRYLAVGLVFSSLESNKYDRTMDEPDGSTNTQSFKWWTWRLGLCVRAKLSLLNDWLMPYVQGGGGVALGVTRYHDNSPQGSGDDVQAHWGYHLGVGGGLHLRPWKHLGFVLAHVEYVYAPVIDNLAGDTHNAGGLALLTGLVGVF